MEKTLNMGTFEALDHQEMMEVDGGYTYLDKPTKNLSGKDAAKCTYYTACLVTAPFCPPLAAIGVAVSGMMLG